MLELMTLGIAGLCFGAALSAHRHRAPRGMVALWFILSGMSIVLTALIFQGNT